MNLMGIDVAYRATSWRREEPMATDTIDEFGPVDYLVVEFPGGASRVAA